MAVMIPEKPPTLKQTVGSEVDVWKALKEKLDDDFYVYYGLPFLKSDGGQEEIDFLIWHRRWGLLNLECKGGGVEWTKGEWIRRYQGVEERMDKSPIEQARSQIEGIVREFRGPVYRAVENWGDQWEYPEKKFPVVYGFALIFARARHREGDLPQTMDARVVLDSEDLYGDLQAAIEEAYRYHGQRVPADKMRLDEDQFRKVRQLFAPDNKMGGDVLAGLINKEREVMAELSERQRGAARRILSNRRVSVEGGAGTGKTVVAMYCAERLVKEGETVLLTCYNRDLAHYLRRAEERLAGEGGRLVVRHFHGLCHEAIQGLEEGSYRYPDGDASREDKRRFWTEETAMALMDGVCEGVLGYGKFDTILVDEAQDFGASWWEVLEEMLADREAGRMVVFQDDDQAIFDREPAVPQMETTYPLWENFRNTKAIAEVVDVLSDNEMEPHRDVEDGEVPTVIQQKGPGWTRRKVAKLVEGLLERQKLEPEQVAILTPRNMENSSLAGLEVVGPWKVVEKVEAWESGEGVLHSTVGSFKGLEADVVVFVDVDPSDSLCTREFRYVAASRAKHRLYVLEKEHWLGDS